MSLHKSLCFRNAHAQSHPCTLIISSSRWPCGVGTIIHSHVNDEETEGQRGASKVPTVKEPGSGRARIPAQLPVPASSAGVKISADGVMLRPGAWHTAKRIMTEVPFSRTLSTFFPSFLLTLPLLHTNYVSPQTNHTLVNFQVCVSSPPGLFQQPSTLVALPLTFVT